MKKKTTKLKMEPDQSDALILSDEEQSAIRQGMDAARRGEFAPDDEMEEFYQLHCKA